MGSILIKLVGSSINALSYLSKTSAANKALTLFSKPRKGQINQAQFDFLATAKKEILYYESHEIMTYRWIGTKKTILLVHGWESNSGRWKPLINHLKNKDHNIIALDAPAHGNSGSGYFNALLYTEFINEVAKKFKPHIIVGHSVGGMATVFFQKKYQLKGIQKLVLLGAPSNFKDVLKRYTDMLRYNRRVTEQLNLEIIEQFGSSPESFSTAKYIQTIHAEGLIIHDKDDNIIPYNDALLIKENYKNSKLISTKGLGHSLNHKSVTFYISEFIEN
ncbi:MAG: alpha/beta hydrolase [Flavobacteriaceae bacterium CG_4_10_14_3_um_filter_33_47]|nr:MAG: alpha/beta hydrolase [Flavobacteriaceae bacterium CG17_big_fil_post_rev_8_21_14_2_50_33_15]PIY12868.1 MAG: alpha/beta hydrolase [Flavobacteriaceae bacterium CG_4_10_14_3_um_filter_33_47]